LESRETRQRRMLTERGGSDDFETLKTSCQYFGVHERRRRNPSEEKASHRAAEPAGADRGTATLYLGEDARVVARPR
jgi:hypothetical protein